MRTPRCKLAVRSFFEAKLGSDPTRGLKIPLAAPTLHFERLAARSEERQQICAMVSTARFCYIVGRTLLSMLNTIGPVRRVSGAGALAHM